MDSRKAYEQIKEEIVDKESAYLCTELERALDRIVNYSIQCSFYFSTKIC